MSIFSRKTVEVQEPLLDHTVYLIDTENVRTVWTLLLDRMTVNDKIYVFYTMNSGNVSYEDLNGVLSSGKSVELIQCHTGKNGLDFQLVSYLGYLIRNNENADYCIISDDSGYDAVIKFWEGRDVDVTRKTAFQVSGKQAKPAKKPLFGGKSRAKTQTVKQSNLKTSSDAVNASATVKAQSEPDKAVRTAQKISESEKVTRAGHKTSENGNDAEAGKKPNGKEKVTGAEQKTTESEKVSKTARAKKQSAESEVIQPQPADQSITDETMQSSVKKTPKPVVKKTGKPTDQESHDASSEKKSSAKTSAQKSSVASDPAMLSKLREYLPEEPEDRIGEIAGIIAKSGGKSGLADIHDEIEKLYRNEKASDIYRAIRRNIKDICC